MGMGRGFRWPLDGDGNGIPLTTQCGQRGAAVDMADEAKFEVFEGFAAGAVLQGIPLTRPISPPEGEMPQAEGEGSGAGFR